MAPSVKNSSGELVNPANWNGRVPSVVDSENDFYNKSNCSFKGYIYKSNAYLDGVGARQTITGGAYPVTQFKVGPYNEITIQKTGSGTVTIQGSVDGENFVNVNTVTSSDGFIRIQSLYRFITIQGASVASTDSVFMQVW